MATVVTKTIKPGGGGDYTTLAAWATARAKDCVSSDTVERAQCYGGGNLGPVSISTSWYMDATRRAEIVASEDSRHDGVYSDSFAHIKDEAFCINASNSTIARFLFVSGLCIGSEGENTGAVIVCHSGNYTEKTTIKDCIIDLTGRIVGGYAIQGLVTAVNCVAYGLDNNIRPIFLGYYASEFLNCTAVGRTGFSSQHGTVVAKNCITKCSIDGFVGSFGSSSDYNCSDIAGDAPGAHSVTGTVQFKDAANKDFHLAAADTVARGAGVNLTASGITTDIDGDARPDTGAWDIGADQYEDALLIVIDVNPAGGGDYTTLQAAYDAEKHNLVAANTALKFACAAGNVGRLATDSACVTGPDNKLIIEASAPHPGYVVDECSYADNYGSTYAVLNLEATRYTLVSRMLIGAVMYSVGIQCTTEGLGTVIEGCIIKFGAGPWSGGNSGLVGVDGTFELYGSAVFGFYTYGLYCNGACIVRSVTLRDCRTGVISVDGTTQANNVLAQCTQACFSGSFAAASSHNLSNDSTAPGISSLQVTLAVFADNATLDTRLLETSAGVHQGSADVAPDRDVSGVYLDSLADAPCIGSSFEEFVPEDPGGGDWWGGGFGRPKFGVQKYRHGYPAYGSGVQV